MKNYVLLLLLLLKLPAFSQSTYCNCFANIDSTYHIVPMTNGYDPGIAPYYRCNRCSSQAIALPFSFCFYGTYYDTVYINIKGSVSFVKPDFDYLRAGFPTGDTMLLAPFLADIADTPAPISFIYYQIMPEHLIVQWNNVGYVTFDNDLYDSFQLTMTDGTDPILPTGNNVSYCYDILRWASADSDGGSGGFGGVPARIGVNKGDNAHYAQFATFNLPGSAYFGPYDTLSQLYWVWSKSFTFNTCVSGNNIPPVILNPDICDTLYVCAGDTLTFNGAFLCSEPGQTLTMTTTYPGLSGVTIDTLSSASSLYRTTVQVAATMSDTGSHNITVIATDNGSPPLTNSIPFVVIIKKCDTILGTNTLSNKAQFSISPNPSAGIFTLVGTQNFVSGIEVYDMMGEKILSQISPQTPKGAMSEIDMSSQPNGIYFYRILGEQGALIGEGKLIIQK